MNVLASAGGPAVAVYATGARWDAMRTRATLQAYFQAGASPARAAEALQVHVNTVTQRLERVSRLIGKDWSSPERALEVQLALRLHRLTSAVAS